MQKDFSDAQRGGFSLVELSIVLVILGLLTGGILTGQNLIRAAELRSVVTEFKTYQTAVMTFRDKYFALPGDMTNATDFWGEMTNCGAASPSGTDTETCNGDGDGVFDTIGPASRVSEIFTFWQHLSNAGLIEGNYTGISGTGGGTDSETSVNTPAAKISNAGWSVMHQSYSSNSIFFDGNYHNSFSFGKNNDNFWTYDSAISPEEAWNIDTKIDDGNPATGNVWAVRWNDCTDATASSQLDANYLLSSNSQLCALAFINMMR